MVILLWAFGVLGEVCRHLIKAAGGAAQEIERLMRAGLVAMERRIDLGLQLGNALCERGSATGAPRAAHALYSSLHALTFRHIIRHIIQQRAAELQRAAVGPDVAVKLWRWLVRQCSTIHCKLATAVGSALADPELFQTLPERAVRARSPQRLQRDAEIGGCIEHASAKAGDFFPAPLHILKNLIYVLAPIAALGLLRDLALSGGIGHDQFGRHNGLLG